MYLNGSDKAIKKISNEQWTLHIDLCAFIASSFTMFSKHCLPCLQLTFLQKKEVSLLKLVTYKSHSWL